MNMKLKSLSALLVLATAAPIVAQAAEEESPHSITGNLSLVSDYRFRGISQTNEGPALQGGFDYAHSSGFYLGTWASNIDFAGSLEVDLYGGYNYAVNDDLSFNVGALYYAYPSHGTPAGGTDPNTLELYAGVTWKWLNLKYSHAVTDTFGIAPDSDGSYYVEANATVPLPYDISMGLHYGYSQFEGLPADADDDYQDWKVAFNKEIKGFNVGLAYVDTDLDDADIADGTVVVSVGKTF